MLYKTIKYKYLTFSITNDNRTESLQGNLPSYNLDATRESQYKGLDCFQLKSARKKYEVKICK